MIFLSTSLYKKIRFITTRNKGKNWSWNLYAFIWYKENYIVKVKDWIIVKLVIIVSEREI
jgi:hypothetical protein